MMAPGMTRSTAILRSPVSSRTSASAGARSITARTAVRAFSRVRASSARATPKRNTTDAASDHSPSSMAPATAMSMSTLMSSDRRRTACHARRRVGGTPRAMDRPNRTSPSGAAAPTKSTRSPRPRAAPEIASRTRRPFAACPPAAIGSSCSSHARKPASATAATIAEADTFVASYFTCSRWPTRSAEKSSRPGRFLNRRSIIATSSRQSIPSILKVDSACSSQTAQVVMVYLRSSTCSMPCSKSRTMC